jgi:hypothetical protein
MQTNQSTTITERLRLTEARSGARVCDPQHTEIPCTGRLLLTIAIVALCWCSYGQIQTCAAPTTKPTLVYVADFDLDTTNIRLDPAAPPPPPKLPGPFSKLLPPPPGPSKDPQTLARELVDSMGKSLVKELTKAGFNARRLAPNEVIPTSGWIVRGVFTNVNQGNQLERAVIGFGKGKTDLQVLVDIADLAQGAPAQFHEVKATASISSKSPGAAPMIVERHPAGVAAKFIIASKDLDRNVKQTAAQIAEEVVTRTGSGPRQRFSDVLVP